MIFSEMHHFLINHSIPPDWSTAGEQGKLVFVISITPSRHWRNLFHFSQRGKIVFRSSKLQINSTFLILDFCQEKPQKRNSFWQARTFVTWTQFAPCALRENLSNRSSRVQIPPTSFPGFFSAKGKTLGTRLQITRDIRTRSGRYLYSTKWSSIINGESGDMEFFYQSSTRYLSSEHSDFHILQAM